MPDFNVVTGRENDWCIRIGDWRVIYTIIDGKLIVDMVEIRHRGDA